VILTSDHGELFERAFWGHSAPVLYQPVIRIPLVIFEPKRTERLDVHSPTSAVDLLPTLLHITAHPPATWSDGMVLPPFRNNALVSNRSIYSFESRDTRPHEALKEAVVSLVRGRYKLIYTFGYQQLQGSELVELYDLESDPEELEDLSTAQIQLRNDLLDELKIKIAEIKRTLRD
jgi:choline-sulfatase